MVVPLDILITETTDDGAAALQGAMLEETTAIRKGDTAHRMATINDPGRPRHPLNLMRRGEQRGACILLVTDKMGVDFVTVVDIKGAARGVVGIRAGLGLTGQKGASNLLEI